MICSECPLACNACINPKTVAEPCMSYFISSILAPGLRDIPPVSNVIPLPTIIGGFPLPFLGLLISKITIQGFLLLPFPTFSRPPILFSRIPSQSITVSETLSFPLAQSFAIFAYAIGYRSFGGALPKSLAR